MSDIIGQAIAMERRNKTKKRKTAVIEEVSDALQDSSLSSSTKKKKRKLGEDTDSTQSDRKLEKKRLKKLAKVEKERSVVESTTHLESSTVAEYKHVDEELESVSPGFERKMDKVVTSKRSISPSTTTIASTSVATTTCTTPSNRASPPAPGEISAYLAEHSITVDGEVTPALTFDQLAIAPELRSALNAFTNPTPIQACAWPALLEGSDVIGIAETGSGKTLAFGLPALAKLTSDSKSGKAKPPLISVLVVAPTRELALQTHDTLAALGEPFGISSVCLFGGMSKNDQVRLLQGSKGKIVRIVVGTPGRILDLCNDGTVDLSHVTYLVLDEADRMLDKGFENDIRSIIGKTSDGTVRQTLMFSATWPDSVRRLASTFLRNPVRITVGSFDLTANSRVTQEVDVFDDPRAKDQRLSKLLRSLNHKNNKPGSDESRILVFVLYKKEAARVEGFLRGLGYSVGGIHGDLGQPQRMKALDEFKTGKTGLLVATDVAARGLDIPNVGAVINYSFPLTIEDYVHRIGRTGRGGRSGKSITFFTGENHERALAGELMRVLKDGGFQAEGLKKFPMTVKKREHSAYGAWFKETGPTPTAPTKIKFT